MYLPLFVSPVWNNTYEDSQVQVFSILIMKDNMKHLTEFHQKL